jgi:ADP-heptose:LPS heptosyltransferase
LKTKDLFLSLPAHARILFLRLRSMGDCLLLTSPVHALKEEFPGFSISILVEPRFAPCFDGNPDFDEVICFSTKLSALRLLLRRFDAIINLHGGPTSLAYSLLPWGRRIGGEQYQYRWLYGGLFPRPDSAVHSVIATMSTFRWLGVRRETPPPLRYEHHSLEADHIRKIMHGRGYAVIHPGALMETKRWATSRFAELAQFLQEQGLSIVLTCGPGEESVVTEVAAGVPSAIILLGLEIPQLAELIRGARLYAGNDSGPMHLAAAVGTPVIAAWGSSESRRWHPWNVPHRVVQNPFECNPCPGYRCLVAETPLCIESVTVEQAVHAAKELLRDDINTGPQSR